MREMALEGIRVLDLTQSWAGPYATKYLADFGAEVIKVESIQRPDPFRGIADPGASGDRPWERSSLFLTFNSNKLDITLDLTRDEGKDLFMRLVSLSDVVVDNSAAGTMERLGLSYDVLRQMKPNIIVVTMPAYGSVGPYAPYRAMGLNMEGMSGVGSVTGYADGAPVMTGVQYGDPVAGFYAVFGILAALYHRDVTGEGQQVELASTEGLTCFLPEALMDYAMNGRVRGMVGNTHEYMVPHGCYRCRGADSWVTIAVASDREWAGLRQAIGNPGWARQEEFGDWRLRYANRALLDVRMEEWTSQREAGEVVRLLQGAGVAAGVVCTAKDIVENEHLVARGFLTSVTHPVAGELLLRIAPCQLSETPAKVRRPAPLLGEHNALVLQGLLGLSDAELELLAEKGILGAAPVKLLAR